MLNAIEELLKKMNRGYIRIDGNTSGAIRKNLVDTFQYDETCACAILSITAANSGITLTAAKEVIFAELHWNPSVCIFNISDTDLFKILYFADFESS